MIAKFVLIIATIALLISIVRYSNKSSDGVYLKLPESNSSSIVSMDNLLLNAVTVSEMKYTVYISRSVNKDTMKPLLDMLSNASIPHKIIESVDSTDSRWYLLVAGEFDSRLEAQYLIESLESRFNLNGILIKYPPTTAEN